ncbi:transcription termination/antitermination NusG family protein [Chryseobacterium sp. JM1]|uniref:transcription termination/antitermination NusG family protein n=1 Tax=Chryseobacterium sp. JM1 TaxID=1233950 RepID=UPI0004E77750|nr:hypothetical protein IW22_21905 [Chryseobacterium sp. JM1]
MIFTKEWYAYTQSRFEKKVTNKLIEIKFEVCLPVSKMITQWTARKKKSESLYAIHMFLFI